MSKCKTHIAGLLVESYDYTTEWTRAGSDRQFVIQESWGDPGGEAEVGDTSFTYDYTDTQQVVLRDHNNVVLHTFEDTQHAWAEIAHKMIG